MANHLTTDANTPYPSFDSLGKGDCFRYLGSIDSNNVYMKVGRSDVVNLKDGNIYPNQVTEALVRRVERVTIERKV